MTHDCADCFHAQHGVVRGRDRIGCMRARNLPDGTTLRAPKTGWEATIERLPQSRLDWRAPGDQCGPHGKNWRQG